VGVEQRTDYPNSGTVKFTLEPSKTASFPVLLRIPRWTKQVSVSVNGEQVTGDPEGGRFFSLEREWSAGDRITLRMPMSPRLVKGRKAQAGKVAVMCGPRVFCLNPRRTEGLQEKNLDDVTIAPDTLRGPETDDSVRPGEQIIRVRGNRNVPFAPGPKFPLDMVLTAFPDPGGRATYFHVLRMGQVGKHDELVPH
jgi:hypothetical protein